MTSHNFQLSINKYFTFIYPIGRNKTLKNACLLVTQFILDKNK